MLDIHPSNEFRTLLSDFVRVCTLRRLLESRGITIGFALDHIPWGGETGIFSPRHPLFEAFTSAIQYDLRELSNSTHRARVEMAAAQHESDQLAIRMANIGPDALAEAEEYKALATELLESIATSNLSQSPNSNRKVGRAPHLTRSAQMSGYGSVIKRGLAGLYKWVDDRVFPPSHEDIASSNADTGLTDFESLGLPDEIEYRDSSFYFKIVSAFAKGSYAVSNTIHRLEFHFDDTTTEAGTILDGKKLRALKNTKTTLGIVVFRAKNSEVHSACCAAALISDGKLLNNVSFDVQFFNNAKARASLWIEINHQSRRLYQFELVFNIVDHASKLPDTCAPTMLNLDVDGVIEEVIKKNSGHSTPVLQVTYRTSKDDLYFSWVGYGLPFAASQNEIQLTRLGATRLAIVLQNLTAPLKNLYTSSEWEDAPNDDGTSYPTAASLTLGDAMEQIADVGYKFYMALRSDPDLLRLVDIIDRMPVGTRVTFRTPDFPVPWELIYPRIYSKTMLPSEKREHKIEASQFWGTRFAIETLMPAEARYAKLENTNRANRKNVSFNLNPTIKRSSGAGLQPGEIHASSINWLQLRGVKCELQTTCADIKNTLRRTDLYASLIYFYCHGTSPLPWAITGQEELSFANDCSCDSVTIYSEVKFAGAPVVFLNSCRSGVVSPLSFKSFLSDFVNKGALGLVATSYEVPITFAAHFGAQLTEEILFPSKGSQSLSQAILRLRQIHVEKGNPAALFYTAQCQLQL